MHKNIYISLIGVFLLIALISGMMIYSHYREADEQEQLYESLAQMVERSESIPETETEALETEPTILPEYAELYEQNSDLIGWICIEDTKINYPVMQSVDEPNFYLKHGFDKGYPNFTGKKVAYDDTKDPKYFNEETDVASVTITWTDMSFSYNKGTWNTQTLSWDGGGWVADKDCGKARRICKDN